MSRPHLPSTPSKAFAPVRSPARRLMAKAPARAARGPLESALRKRLAPFLGLLVFVAGLGCCPAPAPAADAPGREPRAPWTTGRLVGSPYPPPPFTLERWAPGGKWNQPVDLAYPPGSRRLYVAEQGGKLWSLIPGASGAAGMPALVVDLRRHHRPFDNILGFAFHPGFATNRQVFINYNEPGGRENGSIVARFAVQPMDPPTIDPASERVILRWFSGGHNGCTLAFGPDGYLYISTGDAADPDPPDGRKNTGQDLTDLLGAVLRIDVNPPEGTNTYRIPADNPFIQHPGARPEHWAFGFRNPFRMSFDPVTGDLWLGDVGWETWEMIHLVVRGGNYGWPLSEGPHHGVRRDVTPGPGPIRPAVMALPHSEAASITGGMVYRGRRHPRLHGAYIYGDWETGKFWALRHTNGVASSNEELCDTALKPVSFAADPEGELLVLDYNGGLYRLEPNPAPTANDAFPRELSRSGLFKTLRPLEPAVGTLPYQIAAPLWSDHGTPSWLLAVPGRGTIKSSGGVGNIAGGTWYFPTNTVLARTVSLPFADGARPIETQVLHWDGQAWAPYTYRWRNDGSDADLVGPAGTNDVYEIPDPAAPGGRRSVPWRFMTRAECLRCHNAWAGDALTLNWSQLGDPRAPQSQAREWVRAGVLQANDVGRVAPLAHPADDTAPVEERARSWLHVNCSGCHRFGSGGGAVTIHLNIEKPPSEWRAIGQAPLRGDFGFRDARIIAPGDPWSSVLLHRIATEGAGRMPHIGSRLVDRTGLTAVRDWILSLPPGTNQPPRAGTPPLRRTIEDDLARLTPFAPGPTTDAAIDGLLSTMNGSLALLDRAEAPGPLREAAAIQAARHTNAMVRDLFQRLLPPERRRATLGQEIQPATILALSGDANRGRELFHGAAQCGQCHALEGRGRAFGPDLSRLNTRFNRAQLLEQILNPSLAVAPEFRLVSLTLKDGRELNGFVTARTGPTLTLREQDLTEHRVNESDIAERHESSLSAMAEGLLAPLTAQEAADVLQYLLQGR